MPSKQEANRLHAAHYLELAAQCLKSEDWDVLHLNQANIRLAMRQLDDALAAGELKITERASALAQMSGLDMRIVGGPED